MNDVAPEVRVVQTPLEKLLGNDGMTVAQRRELRKSRVRVVVTYAAAAHLFVFGPLFCYWLINHAVDAQGQPLPGITAAKDLFMATFPISSSILAYWFATRGKTTGGGEKEPNDK